MSLLGNISQLATAKRVIANLRRRDERFARGVEMGLKRAGLFVQREAQLQVPVDTGQLKASAFTRHERSGFQTRVTTGFTSAYALNVHEALGTLRGLNIPRTPNPPHKGVYWDPVPRAKPKFLSDPIQENSAEGNDKIGQIVRDMAYKALHQL